MYIQMYIPEGIPDRSDPYWRYDCVWCGQGHASDTARDAHYRTCAARAVVLSAEAHATITSSLRPNSYCVWCGEGHTSDSARDAHYQICAARAVLHRAVAHATIKRAL